MLEYRKTNKQNITQLLESYYNINFLTTNEKIKYLEWMLQITGFQTLSNLRNIKCVFEQTDDRYHKMMLGFCKIYDRDIRRN